MTIREKITERVTEAEETTIFYDGLDDAIIGIELHSFRVVYSVTECIKLLSKDMTEAEAIEYFEFNVASMYVGEKTPILCENDI